MADQEAGSPNAAQIEFWNSAATRAWADQYERMDRAVADLTKALLDMAGLNGGPVRPPLVEVNKDEYEELRAILDEWRPFL